MADIAKSVLGGAWTLLVGWILPTALNLSLFFFLTVPSLRQTTTVKHLWPTVTVSGAVLLLAAAVLFGVVLSALKTPLYRLLEGYLWPGWAYRYGCRRQLQIKQVLQGRVMAMRLEREEQRRKLSPEEATSLKRLREDKRIAGKLAKDRGRTAPQRSLLREKLARYPVRNEQITPTRLGNAIRRLEEYGFDRYRLDSQDLWNELSGTAPAQVRAQVDAAETNVDFFVALLTGHAAVIMVAAGTLLVRHADLPVLTGTIIVLSVLILVWYRSAVTATDEWAASVRALVDVGRKPLAAALGLTLPAGLEAERSMWQLVNMVSRLPYGENQEASELDHYRSPCEGPGDEKISTEMIQRGKPDDIIKQDLR